MRISILLSLIYTSLASAGPLRRNILSRNGLSVIDMNTYQPHPRSQSTNAGDPEQQSEDKSIIRHVPSRYYGLGLNINMHRVDEIPSYGRAPTELNILAPYYIKASQIIFNHGSAVNVDEDTILCQAFKDPDGVEPLGEEFDSKHALELAGPGEELVQVGSILCYVSGSLAGGRYDDNEENDGHER